MLKNFLKANAFSLIVTAIIALGFLVWNVHSNAVQREQQAALVQAETQRRADVATAIRLDVEEASKAVRMSKNDSPAHAKLLRACVVTVDHYNQQLAQDRIDGFAVDGPRWVNPLCICW